jgi:hypothetical protein
LDGIDAIDVYGYAVVTPEDVRHTLPYPPFVLNNTGSKVIGRSFHYGRFVMNLRQKAAMLPKYGFARVQYTLVYVASDVLLLV